MTFYNINIITFPFRKKTFHFLFSNNYLSIWSYNYNLFNKSSFILFMNIYISNFFYFWKFFLNFVEHQTMNSQIPWNSGGEPKFTYRLNNRRVPVFFSHRQFSPTLPPWGFNVVDPLSGRVYSRTMWPEFRGDSQGCQHQTIIITKRLFDLAGKSKGENSN